MATATGSIVRVSVPFTRSHENNRSLDVLSMLNLSKNGQDCTSRFPEVKQETEEISLRTAARLYLNELRPIPSRREISSDFSSRGPTDASRRNNVNDPVKMTTNYNG
ncbi:hypothetical protein Tco_0898280 [Tanacetum coccineum]